MNWILSLKIRYKLFFAFGSLLFVTILITAAGLYVGNRILRWQEVKSDIQSVRALTLTLDQIIRDFNYEGFKKESFLTGEENTAKDAFDTTLDSLELTFRKVQKQNVLKSTEIDSLIQGIQSIEKAFARLTSLYETRGFKDYGVEGSLRRAIHDVENSDYEFNPASMLMLRRHEKDFFLRKDLKYSEKFNEQITTFRNELMNSTGDSTDRMRLLVLLDYYALKFDEIVALEEKIGLTSSMGITGILLSLSYNINRQTGHLVNLVDQKTTAMVRRGTLTLIALLLIQLVAGITLTILYANALTRWITEIRGALLDLASGKFPNLLHSRTKDELHQAKMALNVLINRIKTAVDFASDLGKGNLTSPYPVEFREDVLAKSLIKMQTELVEIEKKRKINSWINEGLSDIGRSFEFNTSDLTQICDKLLERLVKYSQVNQGAIYVYSKTGNELKRTATYAYGKKKYNEDTLTPGDGITGQVFLEGQPVYLAEVPDEYITISSGLGEKTPTSLAIIPLMHQEEGIGILELASFKPFENHVRSYLEQSSTRIATLIFQWNQSRETSHLLQLSRERAHTLSAQEEELRQKTEELMAIQEGMERQRTEMKQYITSLEAELEKLREACPE